MDAWIYYFRNMFKECCKFLLILNYSSGTVPKVDCSSSCDKCFRFVCQTYVSVTFICANILPIFIYLFILYTLCLPWSFWGAYGGPNRNKIFSCNWSYLSMLHWNNLLKKFYSSPISCVLWDILLKVSRENGQSV